MNLKTLFECQELNGKNEFCTMLSATKIHVYSLQLNDSTAAALKHSRVCKFAECYVKYQYVTTILPLNTEFVPPFALQTLQDDI